MLDDEPSETLPYVEDLVTDQEKPLKEDTIIEKKFATTRKASKSSSELDTKD